MGLPLPTKLETTPPRALPSRNFPMPPHFVFPLASKKRSAVKCNSNKPPTFVSTPFPIATTTDLFDVISSTAEHGFDFRLAFPKKLHSGHLLVRPGPGLAPGMGALVRVAVDHIANGLVLPSSAIFRKKVALRCTSAAAPSLKKPLWKLPAAVATTCSSPKA